MNASRKVVIILVSVWLGLGFYLTLGSELLLLEGVVLPLDSWYSSVAIPTLIWITTMYTLAFVVLFWVRYPKVKSRSSP